MCTHLFGQPAVKPEFSERWLSDTYPLQAEEWKQLASIRQKISFQHAAWTARLSWSAFREGRDLQDQGKGQSATRSEGETTVCRIPKSTRLFRRTSHGVVPSGGDRADHFQLVFQRPTKALSTMIGQDWHWSLGTRLSWRNRSCEFSAARRSSR